ncbi:MAG: hypothetical protein Q8K81_04700 [Sulfuricurvum sp.]|nr:hypothetical protein [Sulfuricurvum sp.]
MKRLREISKNIDESEFKNLLAALSNELADVKLEVAGLKEKLAVLQEENRILKLTTPDIEERSTGSKLGCYQFKDDDGLYCTGCWDSQRKKIRTNNAIAGFRICPVCHATIK